MRGTEWCACGAFKLWYQDTGLHVCECGHPQGQHIDGTGLCVGDVRRSRPAPPRPPLKPPYHPNQVPVYACRKMPTRHCPALYEGVCGERPCARYESDDEAPWVPEIRSHLNEAF